MSGEGITLSWLCVCACVRGREVTLLYVREGRSRVTMVQQVLGGSNDSSTSLSALTILYVSV